MTDTILIASHNAHKIAEIAPVLEQAGFSVTDARQHRLPEPVEDGGSFLANARIKARSAVEATGLAVLADDSGLVVSGLDNDFPGVESAPYAQGFADGYAGAVADLLQRLDGRPADCMYVCLLLVLFPDGTEIVARGELHGRLLAQPRGTGTFGFDPWFGIPALGKTCAELTVEEKNALSHRGNALRELQQKLEAYHDLRAVC